MQPKETEPRRRTFLHRAPGGIKLGCTVLFVILIALFPRRAETIYLAPAAVLLVAWIACRMPVLPTLKRLVVVEFFILGIALLSLLRPAAAPVFISALIKSNLSVLALLILVWTTPFQDILNQLRRAGLPEVMLSTLALMYRYLPVLAAESRRMQRARASRTFAARRAPAWKSLATVAGQLFVRSVERAERIYLAMCARGWK